MKTSEIKLWSERGVPYAEIINRIRERDTKDCITARVWLAELDKETFLKVADMAEALRSTREVMRYFEPHFHKSAAKFTADFTKENFMEINALMVEGYVRAADELFPKASKN